jgi:hypothetical protein
MDIGAYGLPKFLRLDVLARLFSILPTVRKYSWSGGVDSEVKGVAV